MNLPINWFYKAGRYFYFRFTPRESENVFTISTKGCQNHVAYLEHVECIITLEAERRGELELFLQSPLGTLSQILFKLVSYFSSELSSLLLHGFSNVTLNLNSNNIVVIIISINELVTLFIIFPLTEDRWMIQAEVLMNGFS